MNKKICAIVITYNRKEELKKNIESLIKQNIEVDILVVDNNSNDGTESLIQKFQKVNDNIIYLKLNNNVGGAGGFYNGIDKALKLGYELFVLMDDDGRPLQEDTIEQLLNVYDNEKDKNVIINSVVYSDYEKGILSFNLLGTKIYSDLKEYIKDDKIEGNINPFNGTLIPKCVIEKIGKPKKEFFISGDETEYSLRAKKNGCRLITATKSKYYHPSGQNAVKKIFGKKVNIRPVQLWRVYYTSRNYAYINKKYEKNKLSFIIKNTIKALLSEKPLLRLKYTILGMRDGYKEIFINDKHIKEELQERC